MFKVPLYSVKLFKEKTVALPAMSLQYESEAASVISHLIGSYDREHIVLLFINNSNKIIGYNIAAIGSATNVNVSIKEILRPCLLSGANAMIIGHNHPSGDVTPSESDFLFTRKLIQAFSMVDLVLLDHFVVSDIDHYSMFKNNSDMFSNEKRK